MYRCSAAGTAQPLFGFQPFRVALDYVRIFRTVPGRAHYCRFLSVEGTVIE
jgi:hypothetical protein